MFRIQSLLFWYNFILLQQLYSRELLVLTYNPHDTLKSNRKKKIKGSTHIDETHTDETHTDETHTTETNVENGSRFDHTFEDCDWTLVVRKKSSWC
tara:strand:+ start:357 stop:644 length:288 start_codon:yes stop_codon:yes gene_type:complete